MNEESLEVILTVMHSLERAIVHQQIMIDSMQKQINALSLKALSTEECLISTIEEVYEC